MNHNACGQQDELFLTRGLALDVVAIIRSALDVFSALDAAHSVIDYTEPFFSFPHSKCYHRLESNHIAFFAG